MIKIFFLFFASILMFVGCQRKERKYSEDYVLIEFAAKLEEENARYHYQHKEEK